MSGIYPFLVKATAAALQSKPVISQMSELVTYFQWSSGLLPVEEMRVLYLNSANHLLFDEVIATGTVNHVAVYVRNIVERCIAANATAIIVVHNHPSGNVEPTPDDCNLTRRVLAATNLVGVVLHDHFIVAKGRWFSFRSAGLMDSEAKSDTVKPDI